MEDPNRRQGWGLNFSTLLKVLLIIIILVVIICLIKSYFFTKTVTIGIEPVTPITFSEVRP